MFHKKQIFKPNVLKKLLTDENSCVSLVSTTRLLALPPFFLNDMKSGILYILNAMLKKYDRSLGGIVIGYQNIKVLMDENTGIIPIGTSETEVNISVEFYIFQPKIGNYLEGVINKKSNTHIGCLVHQYFNATILKPEEMDYDEWICKDFSVDDRVTFKVKDLDFTTLLPYIEGIVEDKRPEKKRKQSENCIADNVVVNYINEIIESESLFSKESFTDLNAENNFRSDFSHKKKAKNRNEEEVSILEENLNTSSGELKSVTTPKKKKKKKKEKHSLDLEDNDKEEEVENSKDQELPSVSYNIEPTADERHSKEKKKKKKEKNKHRDGDVQDGFAAVKSPTKEEDPVISVLGKRLELEDENSNDFVREPKSKKVKKKKRKEKDEGHSSDCNKTSVCLPVEEADDIMFYSTQLEPISEPKIMRIPCFSPIPKETGVGKRKSNEMTVQNNLDFPIHLNSGKETQEKKKKDKKRKREEKEDSVDSPSLKKIKFSDTSKEKAAKAEVNGIDVKSITQIMMEEMYQKLLNDAKEKLNLSDKETSKVKKKKKESKKKEKEKKATPNEPLKVNKSTITQVNGSEEKPTVQITVDKLLEEEMKRINRDSSSSKKEKSKSSDTSKTHKHEKKVKEKRRTKTSSGGVNGEEKKSEGP